MIELHSLKKGVSTKVFEKKTYKRKKYYISCLRTL